EVAAGMHASFDPTGANSTLERLAERVEDRRTLAIGRARVAREGLGIAEIRVLEADRLLLGEGALRRLEAGSRGVFGAGPAAATGTKLEAGSRAVVVNQEVAERAELAADYETVS